MNNDYKLLSSHEKLVVILIFFFFFFWGGGGGGENHISSGILNLRFEQKYGFRGIFISRSKEKKVILICIIRNGRNNKKALSGWKNV